MTFAVLNFVLIGLVLLIAYWWANQGLFSAILHLVCVVAAGAIALAVWEPIVIGLLLRGTKFDDYAWGVTLVLVFSLSLLILRVIMDKSVGANVDLPRWANLVFGFPVGAAAGVITIGIFMIGAGFIQSNSNIMGFIGAARSERGSKVEQRNVLWAPIHQWTVEFYSMLSAGSLYPTFNDTPLRHYNPDLHFQAASLVRDSALGGRGKLSLMPSAADIQEFNYDPNSRRYAVRVKFNPKSRDGGEQLTLSSAQIRLIGRATGFNKPKTVHPDQWSQYDGVHKFDDRSHYITSQPGQSEATVLIEFPGSDLTTHPRFLQIRNTRYRLPPPQEVAGSIGRGAIGASGTVSIERGGKNIQDRVRLSNDIRPVSASSNQKPAGISLTSDYYIDAGEGEFPGGMRATSMKLSIKGIYEPTGTRIVQVDVARESPASLFGAVNERAGAGAKIMLVDSQGRPYYPIGYIHQRPDQTTRIKVDFTNYMDTMDKIPALPTAGGQPLKLLFAVTLNSTIVGFKLGDVTVGTCNLEVTEAATRSAPPPPPDTAGGSGDETLQ